IAAETAPSGISSVAVSPDGSRIATFDQDGLVTVSRVAGGDPVRLPELGFWAHPAGWLADGTLLAHSALALPAQVMRFDPATGRVSLFTTLLPGDSAGVERIHRIRVTPDGETMVLNYRRMRGALFVLDWKGDPP
ncbi:MAG TPA: hypothetical protein VK454_02735, partial [Myxococcaceae bacterium]|nr:hypothetical protein [Myxococcaceae bacterium]